MDLNFISIAMFVFGGASSVAGAVAGVVVTGDRDSARWRGPRSGGLDEGCAAARRPGDRPAYHHGPRPHLPCQRPIAWPRTSFALPRDVITRAIRGWPPSRGQGICTTSTRRAKMLAERKDCRLRAAFAMGYAQRFERHLRGADCAENHRRVGVTHMRDPEGLAGEIADT
jgi:hypothetical protein